MTRPTPAWRSMLFIPVLNERFLARAAERDADCIQLDLEDAIPPGQKDEARRAVASAAARLAAQGLDVVVRINRPWRQATADIEASVCPQVCCLTLPKVPDASHVRAIAEIVDELERERGMELGHTRFVVMIETAEGLLNMPAIAAAHPRVAGMIVGAEDLAVSLGASPTYDTLYIHNAQAVVAARSAGIQPIGFVGTVADYADEAKFRRTIEQAREMGFTGGFCIHPSQVPILNEVFAPSPGEIDWAQGALGAFEQALAQGLGAVTYRGAMVDLPVADRARAILARAAKLADMRAQRARVA
ncbi:CoA ester lyase [Starkeya koreensis]|uniref:CoA ester lyase n=1 Tax=Ancylobacter koreensis TaxID=266121 RepID=A0ABT0DHD8_9HYPH|nr:CoA ester lyase [Ancylobacter koreensis]MCK0206698.1 CoA ester lyase [Ancylobacter koreensis]